MTLLFIRLNSYCASMISISLDNYSTNKLMFLHNYTKFTLFKAFF